MHGDRSSSACNLVDVPTAFCWTRFGTEAGEPIEEILRRKEAERCATGGLFLWGIGNNVAAAALALARHEDAAWALFSPIRSKAKPIDVNPDLVVRWTAAIDPFGCPWTIPPPIVVTSRAHGASGRLVRRYALVCSSDTPLIQPASALAVDPDELVNFVSGAPLGASQVTAIVKRARQAGRASVAYPVTFSARLVAPYVVELQRPLVANARAAVPRQSPTADEFCLVGQERVICNTSRR